MEAKSGKIFFLANYQLINKTTLTNSMHFTLTHLVEVSFHTKVEHRDYRSLIVQRPPEQTQGYIAQMREESPRGS